MCYREQVENDYHGYIEKLPQVKYLRLPMKRLVPFKCHWYNPTPKLGIRIHPQYGIVEV